MVDPEGLVLKDQSEELGILWLIEADGVAEARTLALDQVWRVDTAVIWNLSKTTKIRPSKPPNVFFAP